MVQSNFPYSVNMTNIRVLPKALLYFGQMENTFHVIREQREIKFTQAAWRANHDLLR